MLKKVVFQYKDKQRYSNTTKTQKRSVLLHYDYPYSQVSYLFLFLLQDPIEKRFIDRRLLCIHPASTAKQNRLRACLHGGGGPQVGEVTRLGGVTRLSI